MWCEMIILILSIILVAIITKYIHSTFFKSCDVSQHQKIHKLDYEQDIVYLYQFPRLKTCPNISSYCLKTETFLRAYNIPHKIIETGTLRSRNGTLPFIELNGEHIADSDLIEMRLKQHFEIEPLSAEDEAHATAITRLADNHLISLIIKHKAFHDDFIMAIVRNIGAPTFLHPILHPIIKRVFTRKVHSRIAAAVGTFTPDEEVILLHKDLQTIQNLIRGKYLFGDKITSADTAVFGEIASTYYPFKNKFTEIIDEHYPKLLDYVERIRDELYPNDFQL